MIAIKRIRKERGITQQELAWQLGVTQGAVSQWELGNSKPELDTLVNMARFFGCKVDDLIDKEGA